MRVIVITSAGSTSGGARQALYLARGLKELGHTVYFVAKHNAPIFKLAQDLTCIALPKGLLAAREVLESLFAKEEPTIIHAFHNRAVKMAAYLGTLWRIQKLPVYCIAHRGVTRRPGNPLPYLLPGIRAYLVNSRACAKTLPLLWRRKRCKVVYNSLPENRLRPGLPVEAMRKELGIPASHLVLGTVGNDNPLKGYPLLLEAYARMRHELPPSNLVLVGASPEKWLPLCRELGIEDTVRLIPYTERVMDFVQTFDLFVFASSFIESQPNVLMEAMSLDLPIVASDIGGVGELLPGKFIFAPNSIEALCEKIVEVLQSPGLLHASAAHSIAMKGIFSLDERLKSVLRAYNSVIHEERITISSREMSPAGNRFARFKG